MMVLPLLRTACVEASRIWGRLLNLEMQQAVCEMLWQGCERYVRHTPSNIQDSFEKSVVVVLEHHDLDHVVCTTK